jgi:hypothetical protein
MTNGITIVALIFILVGISGLLNVSNPGLFFRTIGTDWIAVIIYCSSAVIASLGLISGIFILKKKSWARRLLFIICLYNILIAPVTIFTKFDRTKHFREGLKYLDQKISEKHSAGLTQEADEMSRKAIHFKRRIIGLYSGMVGILVIFNAGVIYFLSRPKIREQF